MQMTDMRKYVTVQEAGIKQQNGGDDEVIRGRRKRGDKGENTRREREQGIDEEAYN